MGNLLGSPFRKYVNDTVGNRQRTSGIKENRSLEVISALNSRNAWVKLASAVSLEQNRLNILAQSSYENPLLNGIEPGMSLALKYVLQGGLVSKGSLNSSLSSDNIRNSFENGTQEEYRSAVEDNTTFQTTHRSGILGNQENPAYGVGGTDFGFSPMPGIIDAEVNDLNRGSIKKSRINIKAHNRAQFDIIDILYLRLGYTVCLEWGWNKYIEIDAQTKEETAININDTLIDGEFWKVKDEDYSDFLDKIEKKRKDYGGNYDGIIGVISNFSWDFQPDGTYDIRLEITSLGDVIESLKVNLPPLITEKRDPYAEERLDSLAKELKNRITTEDEFYSILYPGLKDELITVYDSLFQYTQNGTKIFNYTSINIQGDPNQILSLDSSLNLQGLNYNNIADVGGGKSLLQSKVGDKFNWGNIFGRRHEGSVNMSTWKMYISPTSEPVRWDFFTGLDSDVTNTSIVYKEVNGEWKRKSFLKDQSMLTQDTSKENYAFNSAKLSSFDSYWLVGNGNNGFGEAKPTLVRDLQLQDDLFFDKGMGNEITWLSLAESNSLDADKSLLAYYGKKQFLTLFYSWAVSPTIDIAGGIRDERFTNADKDPFEELTEQDKVIVSNATEFKTSIERNKFKNKINNYFFNIRELHADSTYNFAVIDPWDWPGGLPDKGIVLADGTIVGNYAEGGDLFGGDIAGFDQGPDGFLYSGELKGSTIITVQGPKYNASSTKRTTFFEDPIGQSLNMVNPKEWNKKVGFPIYPYPSSSLFKDEIGQIPLDFFKLDVQPIRETYFIRFKVLLNYITDYLIPKKKGKGDNTPIITIDTETKTNICYTIDNMISINPKKIIVKNDNFYIGKDLSSEENIYEKIYPELETFQIQEEEYSYGQIMNVYFNLNRIEEIFDSVDKNNQVSLFTVLKSMCDDINSSLGNVNNLEPIIDKEKNIIKFIDQTSIPNLEKVRSNIGENFATEAELKKTQIPLEVFGYNPNNNQSNFIRNVGMTTEISKNYATAITIGATANGEVPGMEATAFSRWNVGLQDRFKGYLVDGENKKENADDLSKQNTSVLENYESFIESSYTKLGFNKSNQDLTINSEYISTNRNIVKDYYTYAQAESTLSNYDSGSNTGIIESSIGFLPINLKLEMDGLGGIRIYDFIKINTEFLPSNYPETLEFICTGVNHKLSENDWVTNLKTIATYIDKGSKSNSASS